MQQNLVVRVDDGLLKTVKDTALRNGITQTVLIKALFSISPEVLDKLIAENRYEIVKSHKEAKKQRIADRAIEREKNKELLGKLNNLTSLDVEKFLSAISHLGNINSFTPEQIEKSVNAMSQLKNNAS